MEKMDSTPEYIKSIIKKLHTNPYLRIKDQDLKDQGLEPSHTRRWFKKHHNMTFQSYQRMLRINAAFNNIKQGQTVTNTAFDNGFESLSGFNDSYKSIFGDSASQTKDKSIINIVRITSPLGPMFACASDKGVCLLDFTDRKILEDEFKDLCKRLNAVILPGTNKHLKHVQEQLTEYFAGIRNFALGGVVLTIAEFANAAKLTVESAPSELNNNPPMT
jgi:AraC family transcriptional regulator of adaptative response/methylated-DNA-[protein]-cysteine methyltransferase